MSHHHWRRSRPAPAQCTSLSAHLSRLDRCWRLVPPSPLAQFSGPPAWIPSGSSPKVLPHHQCPAPEGHGRSRTNPLSIQLFPLNATQVPLEGFRHQPLHGRARHKAEYRESS